MGFIEDLVLMITKGYIPLSIVESLWLKQMLLRLCGQIQFPSQKQLVLEHLLILLQKIMVTYVFLATTQCATMTTTYDLWMLKLGYDTFALVINFINLN
jgi:hypothetical protein